MLTNREKDVMQWIMEGKTNWEISMILSIGEETVKDYISNIFKKLNAVNRAHAVAIACKENIMSHRPPD